MRGPAIPVEGSPLVEAVGWVEGLLLGSLGTAVAIIAVALLGFEMLQGRVRPKKALRLVLGCFIVFGAPAIARGLTGLAQAGAGSAPVEQAPAGSAPPALPQEVPQSDPYAGASVPM